MSGFPSSGALAIVAFAEAPSSLVSLPDVFIVGMGSKIMGTNPSLLDAGESEDVGGGGGDMVGVCRPQF